MASKKNRKATKPLHTIKLGEGQRHSLRAYYRALVAYRLRNELQLETYCEESSLGVRGVPKSLLSMRSKRRQEMLLHMKRTSSDRHRRTQTDTGFVCEVMTLLDVADDADAMNAQSGYEASRDGSSDA